VSVVVVVVKVVVVVERSHVLYYRIKTNKDIGHQRRDGKERRSQAVTFLIYVAILVAVERPRATCYFTYCCCIHTLPQHCCRT